MYKINYVTTEKDFLNLKEAWNRIVNLNNYSIFSTFEWSFYYWKAFHKSKKLFIITIVDQNDEIICIAPLLRKNYIFKNKYTFISDLDSDRNDFIIKPGYEKDSFDCIMNLICKDLFVLNNISENSVIYSYILSSEVLSNEYSLKKQNVSPYITIDKNWDDYKNTISKKLANDSRRQKIRLAKSGNLEYQFADQEKEIIYMLNKLDEFKGNRNYSNKIAKNYFDRIGIKNFLIEICNSFNDKGYLALTSLWSSNQVCAVHLGFIFKDHYYYYLPSFNPKFFSYSVGRLLMEYSIQKSFELKLKKYDFLNGDEEYKYKYSDNQINIYQFSNYHSIYFGKFIRNIEEIIIPLLSKLTLLRGIRKLFLNIINRRKEKL